MALLKSKEDAEAWLRVTVAFKTEEPICVRFEHKFTLSTILRFDNVNLEVEEKWTPFHKTYQMTGSKTILLQAKNPAGGFSEGFISAITATDGVCDEDMVKNEAIGSTVEPQAVSMSTLTKVLIAGGATLIVLVLIGIAFVLFRTNSGQRGAD